MTFSAPSDIGVKKIMKRAIIVLTAAALLVACKKDKGADPQSGGKLGELVPEAFLVEAKAMGFAIHEGSNPPTITGEYLLAPWRFDKDNYNPPGIGNAPGYTVAQGFTLKIASQEGSAIAVSYVGYYEGDELSKPFIIGSGNNFTVCRHIRMTGGMGALFSYPFAQLISGTLEGGKLRNVQMATIGLKLAKPLEAGEEFTVEGEIDIWSDADGISQ